MIAPVTISKNTMMPRTIGFFKSAWMDWTMFIFLLYTENYDWDAGLDAEVVGIVAAGFLVSLNT
jgi:hypothetical protein